MEFVPVLFKFERHSMLPVLTVTGIAQNVQEIDKILLGNAVELIEMIEQKFEVKFLQPPEDENEADISEGMAAVRFYLLFKDEEEFDKAISSLQEELG